MQRNLTIGAVLLLLAAGAYVFWQLGRGDEPPAGPGAPAATATRAPADAQRAGEAANADAAAAAAAAAARSERVAVPAAAGPADAKAPFLSGQVVATDGRPVAGAKVVAAASLAFANANGNMDPSSFDVADFADADMFDPADLVARAKAELAQRTETVTDGDGRFRIQPRGTSRGVGLRVLARGYAILDRRVERPAGADSDVGVLTVQRGAVVAGRVVDGGGNPVAGAHVRRVPVAEAAVMEQMLGGIEMEMPGQADLEAMRDGETSETDAAGRFELAHVAAGELTLRARHHEHPSAKTTGLTVQAGTDLRDVLLTMQNGAEIRGRVSGVPADVKNLQVVAVRKPDADGNGMGMMSGFLGGDMSEMLADVGMPLGERRVAVEADGGFVLRGLAAASYRLWPTQPGKGLAGNSACGPRVEAAAGSFGVELRYEPGVAVTFTVVDGATREPIERLWVRDVLRGGEGFADLMAMGTNTSRMQHYPAGAVTVANMRAKGKQTLQLTVDAVGYRTFEKKDIVLPKSGSLDLGTIALESAPVLRIAVVAADDGTPVSGATVRLAEKGDSEGTAFLRIAGERFGGRGGPRTATTGPDGRCTLNALRTEKGVVEVDSKQFAPFVGDEITFAASGATDFVARVYTGGRVDVTVVGPDEKPVKDAMVDQKSPSGAIAQKKTDASGVASFERLPPGAHGFRLGASDGPMGFAFRVSVDGADPEEAPWQTLEVADKARASLQLAKKQIVALRGTVRENGVPLAGARVSLAEGEGSNASEQEAAREMAAEMMAGLGGNKRSAKTGEDGAYELAELPEGSHRLRVTHKSRAMPTVVPIVLRNGDNAFDVDLETATLRGIVVDTNGKPVDGARVRVKRAKAQPSGDLDEAEQVMDGMFGGLGLGDGGGSLKSDDTGAFELRGVDPDVALQVHATAKGFSPAMAKATVARGATSNVIELRLGPAGRIKVTAAADAPFAMVIARFTGEGDKVPPVTQMLRKGKGTLDGLRPGTWELECAGMNPEQRGGQKRTVDVVAGQTVDVAF